jgi:hypothetical protein
MSYSPCPDSLNIPDTYNAAVLNSLYYLRDHAPQGVEDTCAWLIMAKEMLLEMKRHSKSVAQTQSCVAMLAQALHKKSRLRLTHCWDMLGEDVL